MDAFSIGFGVFWACLGISIVVMAWRDK